MVKHAGQVAQAERSAGCRGTRKVLRGEAARRRALVEKEGGGVRARGLGGREARRAWRRAASTERRAGVPCADAWAAQSGRHCRSCGTCRLQGRPQSGIGADEGARERDERSIGELHATLAPRITHTRTNPHTHKPAQTQESQARPTREPHARATRLRARRRPSPAHAHTERARVPCHTDPRARRA